ncbi:M48 family metallopeptidase [Serpentinimonas raichei]|uniref:M48 family metallopeptidase n=1 Tax=Serpentinimonas raichei TaxID=1458425 RepID=UPI0005EE536F|nr:M48 family metallopeptidase [Serpentinimonas raichei]
MCWLCDAKTPLTEPATHRWSSRRGFLLAAGAATATAAVGLLPAQAEAQVAVGEGSRLRHLVSAQQLEAAAAQQYQQMMQQARQQGVLAPDSDRQLRRLRAIAQRQIPFAQPWNPRSRQWQWEVNLIRSEQINAFVMPGGKIAFYTGILDELRLSNDEIGMIMGHEMAHAVREHARARMAKTQATSIGFALGAQLLGLGDLGNVAANLGTQLLSLRFSREDETDADLVGLEIAARAGHHPQASVTLWEKMIARNRGGGLNFLSTHPAGPERIRELQANIGRVMGLYEQARRRG